MNRIILFASYTFIEFICLCILNINLLYIFIVWKISTALFYFNNIYVFLKKKLNMKKLH